jgi:hypothetical protein
MRVLSLSMLFAAALVTAAQGAVLVTFTEPDKYVDTGRYRFEGTQVLAELERHFQHLGTRYLHPDQTLRIEVLEVDLAGEERFRSGPNQDVRILRGGADWPRMRLRYHLEGAGKPALSGEEHLSDMNYLQRPITVRFNEHLAYEKRMLDEWFRTKFAPPR